MRSTGRAGSWLKVISGDVLATAKNRVRVLWRRGLATAALGLVLALLAAGGAGFLALAVYFALAQAIPPWSAALIVGAILLALALLGALVVRAMLRDGDTEAPSHPPPAGAGAPGAGEERPVDVATRLGEDLGQSLGRRGVRASDVVVAALVAGAVLGASPALRERIFRTDASRDRQRRRRR